jgi:hypothetical protein
VTGRLIRQHDLLKKACIHLPQDYEPWGQVDRNETPDGWAPDCSCGCRHAGWLEGKLGSDWLVCLNPDSHRAGLVTFEHQGCQSYEDEP